MTHRVLIKVGSEKIELHLPAYMEDEIKTAKENMLKQGTQNEIINDIKKICNEYLNDDNDTISDALKRSLQITFNALSLIAILDKILDDTPSKDGLHPVLVSLLEKILEQEGKNCKCDECCKNK